MASALDLLLSRQAAAAGVGIGTRRNQVLPAPPPTTEIPERIGRGLYKGRRTLTCIIEDLMSPLTETSYAARTYHADARQWANNGIYSFPLRPINRIAVTTGDGLLVTRYLCLAASDSVAGVRIAETDIIETGRTYSAESWSQRVYINGTFLQCGFDAKLTGINFSGKCGRPIALQISPTGSAATEHGSIFDNHVLYTPLITNHRIVELNAKTPTTNKKFQISLAAPGKFFERILDSAWTLLNSQTTPAPHAPFPWNRRLVGFGGLRCFVAYNGYIYTDHTKTTLLNSANRGNFVASTSFPPRYFKFTNNAEYVLPGTGWKFPGDACFPGIFCFPEPWYTSRINPFMLSSDKHIFKCADGQVWRIKATITPGTGTAATDNYKIILENRFDTILETSASVNLQLAEINAKNWSSYPGNPWGAPTGGPTKRPISYAMISRTDGQEAYLIGYWYDSSVSPASEIKRTITSIVRIVFGEDGTSNPTTGVGVTADVTEVDVFTEMVGTSSSSDSSTPGSNDTETTSVPIGTCGTHTIYEITSITTSSPAVVSISAESVKSYKRILWIYAKNSNVFDFVRVELSMVSTTSKSGNVGYGSYTEINTEYCAGAEVHWTGSASGIVSALVTTITSHDYRIAIVSSITGDIMPAAGIAISATEVNDYYDDHSATWAFPNGKPAGNLRGGKTREYTGEVFGPGGVTFSSIYTEGYNPGDPFPYEVGTRYGVLTETSDEFTTLWITSGAAYHYPEVRLWEYIDGDIQDYSAGAGIGPRKFMAEHKLYHGYVFPIATQIQRVSIDARNELTYVAESDTDIGHFF